MNLTLCCLVLLVTYCVKGDEDEKFDKNNTKYEKIITYIKNAESKDDLSKEVIDNDKKEVIDDLLEVVLKVEELIQNFTEEITDFEDFFAMEANNLEKDESSLIQHGQNTLNNTKYEENITFIKNMELKDEVSIEVINNDVREVVEDLLEDILKVEELIQNLTAEITDLEDFFLIETNNLEKNVSNPIHHEQNTLNNTELKEDDVVSVEITNVDKDEASENLEVILKMDDLKQNFTSKITALNDSFLIETNSLVKDELILLNEQSTTKSISWKIDNDKTSEDLADILKMAETNTTKTTVLDHPLSMEFNNTVEDEHILLQLMMLDVTDQIESDEESTRYSRALSPYPHFSTSDHYDPYLMPYFSTWDQYDPYLMPYFSTWNQYDPYVLSLMNQNTIDRCNPLLPLMNQNTLGNTPVKQLVPAKGKVTMVGRFTDFNWNIPTMRTFNKIEVDIARVNKNIRAESKTFHGGDTLQDLPSYNNLKPPFPYNARAEDKTYRRKIPVKGKITIAAKFPM